MKHKTAFYLFTLTIFVIFFSTGCHRATPRTQGSKPATAGVHGPIFADMPTGEYVSLVNTLPPRSRPQRITYNLVIHRTGPGSSSQAAETTYPLIADYVTDLYDCELSPDRQFVSFKEGMPGEIDSTYKLLLWNRKTKRLWKVPGKRLCYPVTAWSPDSRKIAYIQGGDADGEESFTSFSFEIQLGPIYLCVYDIHSGKSRRLARLDQVRDFTWFSSNALLYTPEERWGEAPNIYRVSVQGGAPQKVIAGGLQAVPSPSGRWIAFLGQTARTSLAADNTAVGPTGLYLYDTQRKTRQLIHALKPSDTPDILLWSPDSQRLWSIQNAYQDTRGPFVSSADTKDHPGYGAGQLSEISIPSLNRRNIATLKTTDVRARDYPESQFRWVGVSQDGRFLMVEVEEVGKRIMDGTANEVSSHIVAVSLKDGSVETLWNAAAENWRAMPPQPTRGGTRERPRGHKSSMGQRGQAGL